MGIDLGFLNDRIFVMYDYYLKRTDGMLYQTDIPAATGFWDIQSNMGDFKIWGHEITITSRNLVNEFKWTTNLNVSFNRNKILKLGTENAPIGGYETYGDFNRLEVGQPIGALFGYIYDGVYKTEQELNSQPKHATSEIGTARMVDVNNDKKIDADVGCLIGCRHRLSDNRAVRDVLRRRRIQLQQRTRAPSSDCGQAAFGNRLRSARGGAAVYSQRLERLCRRRKRA